LLKDIQMDNFSIKKEGILLINKPAGCTSHDIVDVIRKKLRVRKVGHAGTLDPSAEGVLIVLVGSYTKLFDKFSNLDKEYWGIMKLGEVTTTGDSEGKVIKRCPYEAIEERTIRGVYRSFQGEILQTPPMVSAKRIGGKRLYKLARRGIIIERPSKRIRIYKIEVLKIDKPYVEFYVKCSKGTYIRKLVEDIGEKLGCGAYVVKIKRTAIGPFRIEDTFSPEEVDYSCLRRDVSL